MALIACLLLVSAPPEPPAPTLPWGGLDFVQYYAALDLLFEGKNPYDQELATARQIDYGRKHGVQNLAPPWALLPSLLVIGLPFTLATYGYLLLNVALLIFCAVCWTLLLFPGRVRYLPFTLLACTLSLPSLIDFGLGQNSLWPLAGFTGWLWFTTRQRNIPAGLFLALTIIKPHLGLLLALFAGLYCLRQRNWSTIVAFVLAVVAATLVTVCLRPTIWAEYRSAVQTGLSPSIFRTYTLNGALLPYLGPSIEYFSYSLLAAVGYCIAMRTWKRFKPEANQVAELHGSTDHAVLINWSVAVCMTVIPTVPYAWLTDFVFLLPGLILTLGLCLEKQRSGCICFILWILMDVWIRLAAYEEGYWIVPWLGLGLTILLLRPRFAAVGQAFQPDQSAWKG